MGQASRDRWVEKQIRSERGKTRLILKIVSFSCGALVLLIAFLLLSPHLAGLHQLDSADKLTRFLEKDYVDAVLAYDMASDSLGTFTVTTSNRRTLSVMMNGAYMEAPLGADPSEKEYRVYALAGSGYTVLFCTEGTLRDTGSVHVQSQYRELGAQIIDDFLPGEENVYVLYDAGSLAPAYIVMAISALAALFLALFLRSPFLEKRSYLGRQLATLGDYENIKAEINRQALQPLFENGSVTILGDWAFFRVSNGAFVNAPQFTTVVPADKIKGIAIAKDEADEADDEEVFVLRVHADGYSKAFDVYLTAEEAAQMEALKPRLIK